MSGSPGALRLRVLVGWSSPQALPLQDVESLVICACSLRGFYTFYFQIISDPWDVRKIVRSSEVPFPSAPCEDHGASLLGIHSSTRQFSRWSPYLDLLRFYLPFLPCCVRTVLGRVTTCIDSHNHHHNPTVTQLFLEINPLKKS